LVANVVKADDVNVKDVAVDNNIKIYKNINDVIKAEKKQKEECVIVEKFALNASQDKTAMTNIHATNVNVQTLKNAQGTITFLDNDKAYFPYAKIDNLTSSKGMFQGTPILDKDKNQSGSSLTLKGTHVADSLISNSTIKNSTLIDPKVVNLNAAAIEAKNIVANTIKAPTGGNLSVMGSKANFKNIGADLATIKSAQVDVLRTPNVQADNINISKNFVSKGTADFNKLTAKTISGNVNASSGTFDSITAAKGSFTDSVMTAGQLCVGNACLDKSSMDKLQQMSSSTTAPSARFKGGSSKFNPNNLATEFPDQFGINSIRGDTNIVGNTFNAGDLDVGGVINFKNKSYIAGNGNSIEFGLKNTEVKPLTVSSNKVQVNTPFYSKTLWSDADMKFYAQGKPQLTVAADGKVIVDKEICLQKGENKTCFNFDDVATFRAPGPKGDKGDKGDTGYFDSTKVIESKGGINSYAPISVDKSYNGPIIEKGVDNNKFGLSHSATDNALRLYATGSKSSINLSVAPDKGRMEDAIKITSDKQVAVSGKLSVNGTGGLKVGNQLCIGKTCLDETTLQNVLNKTRAKDCQTGNWSGWSQCSASCGGGSQTRTRPITQQPTNGGASCPTLTETQSCNTQACAKSCQVGNWSGWSQCSASCGGGSQTRTRPITQQPANGGASCPTLTETQSCNTQACPKPCQVGNWSGWSQCSGSCGGDGWQNRTRPITQQPANGGASCPALVESQKCKTPACNAPYGSVGSRITSERCIQNACIVSPNGYYKACQQPDGHFVIYNRNNKAIWATGKYGNAYRDSTLCMQNDGHLVNYKNGGAYWASGKYPGTAYAPYHATMQDDGNFVVYNRNSEPIFATGTNGL
jgi:hypothetical protein